MRHLDERLKRRLRVRAATRRRSMEEEARQILRTALCETEPPSGNLAERSRLRFAKLGDVKLPIAARSRSVTWRCRRVLRSKAQHSDKLATRNVSDFERCGLSLVDPWGLAA
jgi:plasmid stability protein